jgi:hypothetical protein
LTVAFYGAVYLLTGAEIGSVSDRAFLYGMLMAPSLLIVLLWWFVSVMMNRSRQPSH